MSKAQATRITELEEQLCRALTAGLGQQKEINRLTAAVETWRIEAETHKRDKERLAKELSDYQSNVSESLDHTTAYEAELKADRDHWRKLCQDGWAEVADGPVSRKLREDLASFMISHSFATGHGDSHTDLLGELGPQIAALRARLAAAERDAERFRFIAVDADGLPFCDQFGDVDLHEQATIYASARGNEEPDRDDYLAAARDAIDAARGGA